MSKGSPSVPQPPDPATTAAAQSTSNVNTAAAQAALNNVNQYTPFGATTYSQTGSYTTPSGQTVPTYSQATQLNPLAQSILTGQESTAAALQPTMFDLAARAGQSTAVPLNTNTPFSSTLNQGPQLLNQNVTNAIYGQQKSFLDPQWNQQATLLQDQLSRQGIPVGSAAYDNAMQQLNNARTQAYQSAQDSAIGSGTSAASNLFNMALQGQQQNLGQQQLLQSNPISLMQQILGAAPSTQSQPIIQPGQPQVAPTDVTGATLGASQQAMNAYQAQVAQNNAQIGGEAGLAGTALTAAAIFL